MSALQSLAQIASSQIVNCFLLGLAIAAVATTLTSLCARKNSGTRFAVWFAAMLVIASLFFLFRPFTHSAGAVHVATPQISLPAQCALYIFFAWAFFAAIGLVRVVRGLWRVRSLKKSCSPLESTTLQRLHCPATSRRIVLCTSESLRVPAALGFFSPRIVLPAWTLRELSTEELNAVILHEAAHLDRWDDWTNLVQKVIRALLFFHPAVWWIDSRLSIEREISCDDAVLACSPNARRYAACLVSLAEKTHAHQSLALVQAAIGHVTHTAQRISKILDGRQRTVTPLIKPVLAALTVFGAISLVAVQHTPQLISFRADAASSSASAGKYDYVATVDPPAGKVIAASVHLPGPQAKRAATAKGALNHRETVAPRALHNALHAPLPTEALRQEFDRPTAAVVNAAMSDVAQPSFVYLVTQSEQYDSFGNVTITTSVWRIRVVRPAPHHAENGAFPHQT
jgi:beta-lactamase regulating signal transducer with metallopeptidase domain